MSFVANPAAQMLKTLENQSVYHLGFIPQHFNSFFATLASKLHQNVVLFLFCGRLDLWYETNDCMLVWGGIFVLNYNLQLWYCRPLELVLLHTFQDAMQGYYPHLTFLGFKCFRIVLVWPRGCWTAGRKASWVLNGQFHAWLHCLIDCRGVNISLTKPIWKLSNDKSVRLLWVCENSMLLLYCCDPHYDLCFTIPSLLFLNCMGCDVILALKIIRLSEGIVFIFPIVRLFFLSWMALNLCVSSTWKQA